MRGSKLIRTDPPPTDTGESSSTAFGRAFVNRWWKSSENVGKVLADPVTVSSCDVAARLVALVPVPIANPSVPALPHARTERLVTGGEEKAMVTNRKGLHPEFHSVEGSMCPSM